MGQRGGQVLRDNDADDGLRGYLSLLEQQGQVARVKRQVESRYEIAGVMLKSAMAAGPVLLFENVKGYSFPVVGNLCASRERLALALGTTAREVQGVYQERIRSSLPVEVVTRAPCQEEVLLQVDLSCLPIITAHEHDAGPYITAGVIIVRDPRSGIYNLSFQRILPIGKDRAAIYVGASSDLMRCYFEAGKNALPVAIAIGLHPAFLLAAAVSFPFSVDELEIVGSLQRQPVRMVEGLSIPLCVPASAEIILEGKILPGETVPEGPFGEYTGYYGAGSLSPRQSQVIEFTAMSHRSSAIYQALISGPTLGHESSYLSCLAKEGVLLQAAKAASPAVEAVNVMLSRYIAVVRLNENRRPGDVSQIMAAAFNAVEYVKYVILVDNDVDISSYSDVLWAVSTRVDPGKDLRIFPKMRMQPLDPSTEGFCDKIGFDATYPLERKEGFTRTKIVNFDAIDLRKYLGRRPTSGGRED